MKKILSFLIVLLLSITLVSCLEGYNVTTYQSDNNYEQKIINTSEKVKDTNVSIFKLEYITNNGVTNNKYTHISNGVIVKRDKNLNKYLYYVLTVDEPLLNYTNLAVSYKGYNKKIVVNNISKNTASNIAIITFESSDKLNVASTLDGNDYYLPSVGKTIISYGVDYLNGSLDGVKQGFISNVSENHFTHDASVNYGELGSGVYDTNGYLIGINSSKIYNNNEILSGYYVLGLNEAISSSVFIPLIKNLSNVNLRIRSLGNEYFVNNKVAAKENKDDLEQLINNIYTDKSKYVVSIIENNNIYSGTIYQKIGNDYYILTTYIDDINNTDVYINNSNYKPTLVKHLNNKKLISIIKITTTNTLDVLNDNNFNTGVFTKKERGSYIVTLGNVIDRSEIFATTGTLSDNNDVLDFRFMHSSKTNFGQLGSPIFNLNGDLIGVNIYKINDILTTNGNIAAESLSYGYNIEDIYHDLNMTNYTTKDYISSFDYEEKIISTVNKVLNQVVTVKTNVGHGSGIIYKEEKKGNTYTYYVLSNEHVIEGASEISIAFNDGKKSVRAKDFYYKKSHDYAVIRFVSDFQIDYFKSNILNNNDKNNLLVGQSVIAIGSPEDSSRKGYVTIGNITRDFSNYLGVNNLQLNHSAGLNPGNSGGPLFDLNGNLIGLNVAKMTNINSFATEGISITLNLNVIAANINTTSRFSEYYVLNNHAKRLGVTVVEYSKYLEQLEDNQVPYVITTKIPSYFSDYIENSSHGILVVEVDDLFDSYNYLKPFDVITYIDGVKINDSNDVSSVINFKQNTNLPLEVTVLRKGFDNPLVYQIYLS